MIKRGVMRYNALNQRVVTFLKSLLFLGLDE